MTKIILVTGGAGFIGSNLCEELSKDPQNKIYSLDNYSTGSHKNHVDNVNYIEGETANIDTLITFTPDIIYHLGEYSRVEQSFEDIEKVWRYNKDGIFAVLQFCRKTSARLIYAGSSTKFAKDGGGANQSPYAWTKSTNTTLVQNYHNWFGLDYAIIYFYNVYGNREISNGKYATLIALFKQKIQNNQTLSVVSPGTQQRNFTFIDDIISGIILVGRNGVGDGYGIGSSEVYTVLEIADMFGGNVEMLPERKGNRMAAELVTAKTKALGWRAQTSIKQHVQEFLKKHSE